MVTNHNNLFILVISKITTYGGLSNAMGQGISKAGSVFPYYHQSLVDRIYDWFSC